MSQKSVTMRLPLKFGSIDLKLNNWLHVLMETPTLGEHLLSLYIAVSKSRLPVYVYSLLNNCRIKLSTRQHLLQFFVLSARLKYAPGKRIVYQSGRMFSKI